MRRDSCPRHWRGRAPADQNPAPLTRTARASGRWDGAAPSAGRCPPPETYGACGRFYPYDAFFVRVSVAPAAHRPLLPSFPPNPQAPRRGSILKTQSSFVDRGGGTPEAAIGSMPGEVELQAAPPRARTGRRMSWTDETNIGEKLEDVHHAAVLHYHGNEDSLADDEQPVTSGSACCVVS